MPLIQTELYTPMLPIGCIPIGVCNTPRYHIWYTVQLSSHTRHNNTRLIGRSSGSVDPTATFQDKRRGGAHDARVEWRS